MKGLMKESGSMELGSSVSLEGKRKMVNGKGGQKFPIFLKYLYDNENIMF